MLPQANRLHRSADFSTVLRRGRRAGRPLLSVALLTAAAAERTADPQPDPVLEPLPNPAPRAGLVVSKAVGGSVVRHRTARRLRGLLATRLMELPAGSRLVVRAAEPAGTASSIELAGDLDLALARVLAPARPRSTTAKAQR